MSTDPRLQRLLGVDELGWLVARVRRRIERGEVLTGTVTRPGATSAERDAVHRLLGRRPRPGSALSVRLEDVDEVVRRSGAHPDGLAAAVVVLTGAVTDRAGLAADREAAWVAAFAPVDGAVERRPALRSWADGLRATGAVRRITQDPAEAAALLRQVAVAIDAMPAEAEPVGRFAERVLGSAHALDTDRPLARLLFGAVRLLGGAAEGSGASWQREVWASVGLVRDELSSTVLTLGLPGDGASPTGRMLGALGEAGEPAVLTLRQLTRSPPRLHLAGVVVSVCENPVVVAGAAERLGRFAAPLICAGGQPGAAVMTLLRAALADGATLRYHGDFDWGGLRIGNVVFGRLPVEPWRFDTASYRAAAHPAAGRELTGGPVDAVWDPGLASALRERGRAVEEERVLDDLVADLGRR